MDSVRRQSTAARWALGIATSLVAAFALSACTYRATPDGSAYTYSDSASGSSVTVSAPSSSGTNNREIFWSQSSPVLTNSTVCATFAAGQGIDQQGVVLRIADGRAISVMRNIWADDFDTLNFDTWNMAANPPYSEFASVTLPTLPYAPPVYPLTLCATAAGDVLSFTVTGYGGGSAVIPAGSPTSGQDGFYVGHLVPGTSTTYTDLTIDGQAPGSEE